MLKEVVTWFKWNDAVVFDKYVIIIEINVIKYDERAQKLRAQRILQSLAMIYTLILDRNIKKLTASLI